MFNHNYETKLKSGLNMKLEVIHLCEVTGPSKHIVGQYELTSFTFFAILHNKDEIWSLVLCYGRPLTQKEIPSAENKHWIPHFWSDCEERLTAIPVDGLSIGAEKVMLSNKMLIAVSFTWFSASVDWNFENLV